MAILTSVSRILLVAKANTTDAERKMKKLTGTQRDLAKAAIVSSAAQNEAIESNIIRLGKLAIGIGVAAVAFRALGGAVKRYADIAQKENAAVGADVEAIQKATGGLITRYEALSFAAAALNTDFKLTQGEMEQVAKAFTVLRNQGNAANETLEGFTRAIVEGNVRALRTFGIILEGSTGTTKAFNNAMEAARDLSSETIETLGGDKAIRAGVEWSDAMDDMAAAAGKLAEPLSVVVGLLADIIKGAAFVLSGEFGESLVSSTDSLGEIARIDARLVEARKKLRRVEEEQFVPFGPPPEILELQKKQARFTAGKVIAALEAERATLIATVGPFRPEIFGPEFGPELPPDRKFKGPKKRGGRFDVGAATLEFGSRRFGAGDSAFAPAVGTRGIGPGPRIRPRREKTPEGAVEALLEATLLPEQPLSDFALAIEGLLGIPFEKFGKKTKEKIKLAEEARKQLNLNKEIIQEFKDSGVEAAQVFQQAGVAAFDAWITGAKGVGQAIKESIGGSLRALATDMLGRALFHGAMAIGSLAAGGPAGAAAAALHGKAAAAFAGGAVVVGGFAKALGGGVTPGGAGGGGGGAPGGGGGGGTGTGATTITVFVGEDFGENVKQNGQRLARAFRRARAAEGSDDEFFLNS